MQEINHDFNNSTSRRNQNAFFHVAPWENPANLRGLERDETELECKEGVTSENTPIEYPRFPCFVFSEDFFFSSNAYEPKTFNHWYRKNGWYRPINVLLPFTLLIFIGGVVTLFVYLNRVFQTDLGYWISTIVMAIVTVIITINLLYTISSENQDDRVLNAQKARNIDYVKITGIPVIDPESKFCNICQVKVGDLTKHCKTCNKCVEVYDHHCMFLSTCIGKKNYQSFMWTIALTSVAAIYAAILATIIFICYFTNPDLFISTMYHKFPSKTLQLWMNILIAGFALLYYTVGIGLANLTIFHLRLIHLGITTVGYFESRAARGPSLWSIKKKDFKARMDRAEKFKLIQV